MDNLVKPTAPKNTNETENKDPIVQEHMVQEPEEKSLKGGSPATRDLMNILTNQTKKQSYAQVLIERPLEEPKSVAPVVKLEHSKDSLPIGSNSINGSDGKPCHPKISQPDVKQYSTKLSELDIKPCNSNIPETDSKPCSPTTSTPAKRRYTKNKKMETQPKSPKPKKEPKKPKSPKPKKPRAPKPKTEEKKPRSRKQKIDEPKPESSKGTLTPKNSDPKLQDQIKQDGKENALETCKLQDVLSSPTEKQSEAQLSLLKPSDGKKQKPLKQKNDSQKPGSLKGTRTPKNSDPKLQDQVMENAKENSLKRVSFAKCKLPDVSSSPTENKSEAQKSLLKPSEESKSIKPDLKSCTDVNLSKPKPSESEIKFCIPTPLSQRRMSLPAISRPPKPVASETEPNLNTSNRKMAISKRRGSILIDALAKPKASTFEPEIKPPTSKKSVDQKISEADLKPLNKRTPAARRRSSVMIEPVKQKVRKTTNEPNVKTHIPEPDMKPGTSKATKPDMKPSTSKVTETDTKASTEYDNTPSTSEAGAQNNVQKPNTFIQFKIPKLRVGGSNVRC